MLSIYKFNLFKYFKSPSTWVILAIACFISGFLGGYLPFSSINVNKDSAAESYSQIVISIVAGMATFLSLFVSIFAGFKSATMFKDEVEDGTFLVTLSKPVTRRKIIFGKWLALQTVLVMFTFTTSLFYCIFTYAFDVGNQIPGLSRFGVDVLKDKIFIVSLTMWGILILMGLIFSSIALLISTRFSVGTTIGISIAIGVIVPITSLLTTFTKKDEYKSLDAYGQSLFSQRFRKFEEIAKEQGSSIDTSVIDNDLKQFDHDINDPLGIYSLGLRTGDRDDFTKSWFADLDFQLHLLSEYASERVVPSAVKESVMAGSSGLGQFGGEGLSNKPENLNPISSPNNDDYKYITNYLSKHLPFIWKFMLDEIHITWKVLEDLISKGLGLDSINYGIPTDLVSSINNLFNIDIAKDLDDLTTLQDIIDNDYANPDSKNHITKLGYNVNNDPKPTGEDLKKQWWVNWYKLSKAIQIAKAKSTDKLLRIDHNLWIKAMSSLFTDGNNLGSHSIQLNDFIGYRVHGHETAIRAAYNISSMHLYSYWPKLLSSIGRIKESNAVSSVGVILAAATRPFSEFIFNYKTIEKYIHNNQIKVMPLNTDLDADLGGHYNLASNDRKTLINMLSIAKETPGELFAIKSHEYVKKDSILLVYLGIAIFLVPVSYWIVRRKDFR